MAKQRDISIDILRTIGMFFIILSHVNSPSNVFNLISFQVVMLMFASGLSFEAQDRDYLTDTRSYLSYIVKRLKRLLLPTWAFLIVYFAFFNIVGVMSQKENISFSMDKYVLSFTLVSGIGYVWIFRVYLLMAIVSPFLHLLNKKLKKRYKKYIFLTVMIIVQELLVNLVADKIGILPMMIKYFPGYMLGYGIIVFIAMMVYKIRDRHLLYFGGGILGIFLIIFCKAGCPQLSDYKYPPQLLYSAYGISISLIVLYVSYRFVKPDENLIKRIVSWVSKNSLTIYYFHIFVVSSLNYGLYRLPMDNWVTRFVFVCMVSIMLTWGYVKIKQVVLGKIKK